MSQSLRIHRTGSPEVLVFDPVERSPRTTAGAQACPARVGVNRGGRLRWALAVLCLAGCGTPKVTPADAGGTLRAVGLSGTHLASCDDPNCGNGANPPLGGDHCPTPLACRLYDTAQLRCQWIHNLEHGHAVLAYNCPTGCPELVSQLTGLFNARQARILVTPDPKLPHKVAALVWGFGWQGDDFNAAAIDEVLTHQDEEAPEPHESCSP